MVGLLIVSHSAKLAEGVCELAAQMAQEVPLLAVGGTSGGLLGTNPASIQAAIAALVANQAIDAILVLVDLGSAVINAELALEHCPLPFVISDAPLVEGAVLAAVEAAIGSDLADVARAAERAREFRKRL